MTGKVRWVLMVIAVWAAAHLACIDQFGWFRDEFYYLACGAHPAFGYVDHPPLIGWIGALVGGSHSFLVVRAPSLIAGALTIWLTYRLAQRMGARQMGAVLASVAVALTPTYLFMFHTLQMNGLEVLLWTAGASLVLGLEAKSPRSRWVLLGVVVGIGLLNKHSMAFWTLAVVAGMLLTERRRALVGWGPWIAVAVASLVVLPHAVWQVKNGFPTLEFYRNAAAQKNLPMTPLGFIGAQFTLAGPGNALLWLVGLGWLLIAREARGAARALGFAFLLLLGLLIALHAKAYYLAPFFPVLFAAGGAALDRMARARVGTTVAVAASVVLLGVAGAPLALPILSVDATIAFGRATGVAPPQSERSELGELPKHYADMFGWESLVSAVAAARESLPADERSRAQIIVGNYGEAGAIDWLGPAQGLPAAMSPHNSYFGWGTPAERDPVIVVGGAREVSKAFREAVLFTRVQCDHCMPYERDLPVFVCRGWQRPPAELWNEMRFYR